ncbi:hypothetical protein QWM81_27220 [Streptomyces ficellus]|uniref:Uncharacterized protein n=1 Tax=Streptomyces ficellus TaxID=1977088 RepID=A0ABT7ZDS2_9ACTN|nr:hypothetical protein [Streptomyces ficellus]MDN3297663.1 hypothetical protein [Streptomyces ficellus]
MPEPAPGRRTWTNRRLSGAWALTLSFDFMVSCLAALALCGIALLLPGLTEDYDQPTWSAGAVALFGSALVLLGSLAVTVLAVFRAGRERVRRAGLTLSVGRLGLLVLGGVGYVGYGVVSIEFA